MQVSAVAVEVRQSLTPLLIYSFCNGGTAIATAAALLSAGHDVVMGMDSPEYLTCDIYRDEQDALPQSSALRFRKAGTLVDSLRHTGPLLICCAGKRIPEAAEHLAPALRSGQTIFMPAADIGASFEMSHRLSTLRPELSVNVIEMGRLFEGAAVAQDRVTIRGIRPRVPVAGRSINETRAGIAIGSSIWQGLVPASNILERSFFEVDRLLSSALQVFLLMDSSTQMVSRREISEQILTPTARASLKQIEAEVLAVARTYKVGTPEPSPVRLYSAQEWDQRALRDSACAGVQENLILISQLGSIARLHLPMLESVIELACIATGEDLRKTGRKIEDLGLVGMDFGEIIEAVNS